MNREKEKCGLTVSSEFQEETEEEDAKHGKGHNDSGKRSRGQEANEQ